MKTKTIRFSQAALTLFAAAALSGCAGGQKTGGTPDTDLAVFDEGGGSVPGDYEVWSPHSKDSCSTSSSSCSVSVPEGDYYLTFKKLRGGRLAQSGGGNIGGERATGCLRARVHLVPGIAISCKKTAEYNCSRAATETMDCGAASSAKYGAAQKKPVAPMEAPPEESN